MNVNKEKFYPLQDDFIIDFIESAWEDGEGE
jgi:hypothetical protein